MFAKEPAAAGPAGKRGLFYGYVVVAAAFVMWVTCWGMYPSFGIFLKPMAEELGWTRTLTSGAYSLGTFVAAFLGAIAGRLSDRLGPRRVIGTGGALLGIGFLLMSQASTVWQVYLFWGLVTSAGMSVVGPALISTVSRWFVRRRGVLTSF